MPAPLLAHLPSAKRMPDSLITRLLHHAQHTAQQQAVISARLRLDYAGLAAWVSAEAAAMRSKGICHASVVGLSCDDDVAHLVLSLAAIAVGARSCTLSPHDSDEQRDALITRAGVSHVFQHLATDGAAAAKPPTTSRPEVSGADLLFATSGTTGTAKLVLLRDSDLVAQAPRHVGSADERFVCIASMAHNFAKRHRLYCVAQGACNVFVDAQQELVTQLQALHANVLHVSAYQARELLALPDIGALSDIRLKLGGSHVPKALRDQLRAAITTSLQAGYGTTETGAIAFTEPDDSDAGETVGQPLPGIDVRITDADNNAVPRGETGDIAIRCNGMFREYDGNPALTAAKLVDGWFMTGDIGALDAAGRLQVAGRADDMFVFNSMNIVPQTLEASLCRFAGVADAAVVPRQSPVHGAIPVALLVSDGTLHLAALKRHMRDQAGLRAPRQYIVVERIPRNAAGKILRQAALEYVN